MNNSVKTSIQDSLKGIAVIAVGTNGALRFFVDELGCKLGIVSYRTVCRHLATVMMHMCDIADSTEWARQHPKYMVKFKEDLREILREYV